MCGRSIGSMGWLHGVRDAEGLIRKMTPEHARPLVEVDGEVRRKTMVEMVMEGLTNREISQRLNVHRATVEKDLRRIYRVHGVKRREGLREVINRRDANIEHSTLNVQH
jgi:DNA-binding CsgD family transcriptional regulator